MINNQIENNSNYCIKNEKENNNSGFYNVDNIKSNEEKNITLFTLFYLFYL